MDLSLKGKKALVTGASRGIGAAIAEALASEGADVVLVGRDEVALSEVCRVITSKVPSAIGFDICDVSDDQQICALSRRHPDIGILINNAGAVPGGSLFDITDAEWRRGWDSKLFAYLGMCREFYPGMKERGGGVIVNILGNGSRMKRFDYLCGGMANAALDFFTETLGASAPADNIRVVGVSPGPVDTERYRRIRLERSQRSGQARSYPFDRIPTPEEIAAIVAFVASDRAAYVSGAILVVDGGMSVAREAGGSTASRCDWQVSNEREE